MVNATSGGSSSSPSRPARRRRRLQIAAGPGQSPDIVRSQAGGRGITVCGTAAKIEAVAAGCASTAGAIGSPPTATIPRGSEEPVSLRPKCQTDAAKNAAKLHCGVMCQASSTRAAGAR